jgi:hypothetical protein
MAGCIEMPTLDELIADAVGRARAESQAILKLADAPLAGDETPNDRIRQIARHGIKLAEAYAVIETAASHVSPQSSSGAPSDHRGVPREDPNAN